jgi:hypothetical protein
MKNYVRPPGILLAALALVAGLGLAVAAFAENIDPSNDGSQYAWGENVGWINAEPANCSDCGVEVSSTELTGWMWGENIGWINLNCSNNGTCGFVDYGVTNDGVGNLAGYAWGENVGWISFSCDNTSNCGFVDYGVTIAGNGEFSGYAWGENVGWISFSCQNQGTCGIVDYGVETAWTLAGAAVGGVAELPSPAGQPDNLTSAPVQGPDPSPWPNVARGGGLAVAAAIAAGMGVWYVRRRWLRPSE